MAATEVLESEEVVAATIGAVVAGVPHDIGDGFSARHFSEEMFRGRMDPLLMVDHFVMTGPTFAPHPHAGISAVTLMFEDSVGDFLNRDTLGNKLGLRAGDLYWLAAASGAAHEETPAPGARVHALQIFVNLPASLKGLAPSALHVRAADVPERGGEGFRVRVLLGRSGDVQGAMGTPEEMTMLDGYLRPSGAFSHCLVKGNQTWIYAESGSLTVRAGKEERVLKAGSATTIDGHRNSDVIVHADDFAHFVLMSAKPIRESFVKHGPLVMATAADVQKTLAMYAAGVFGSIPV